ncbi:MAG: cytochrome C oxidase subunit IV family protein [Gemmatimonadota bacterium]
MRETETPGEGSVGGSPEGPASARGTFTGGRTAEDGSPGAPAAETHRQPNYMAVWFGLFVLTVAEVAVAFVSHLPRHVILLLLLGMAIWKALLVALYYMHLRFEPNRLRLVALAPLPLAVIMVLAILTEY